MKGALQRSLRELEPDRQPDVLTFPPRAFDEATDTLLSNLRESGYCTFVVASPDSWNPRAPYYEQVRRAAREGRKIERVFLLSHRHARSNPSLAAHVRLDVAAGIRTTVLNIGDLLAQDRLSSTDRLEVGLSGRPSHLRCHSRSSGIRAGVHRMACLAAQRRCRVCPRTSRSPARHGDHRSRGSREGTAP